MRYCSHRFLIPCEKKVTSFTPTLWVAAARRKHSCSFARNENIDKPLSKDSTFSGIHFLYFLCHLTTYVLRSAG